MPTYTYRCSHCGHHFDLHQRFSDPDPDRCPNCGRENELQRVYKPVGVVFKGTGFYATDNKSRSGVSTNGASSNGSAAADEKGGKSSDDAAKPKDAGSTDSGPKPAKPSDSSASSPNST